MLVIEAKEAARHWIESQGVGTPDFLGAFLAGSINWLPDDAQFPATSDVDVMVVLSQTEYREKPGKFNYQGVTLEASYMTEDRIGSAERLLGDYRRGSGFSRATIISDPSGQLTQLQYAVAKDFSKREWVLQRCEDARNNTLRFLNAVNVAELYHDQVTCWLFGTGGPTHLWLTAGMKNPTVRRRYLAAREVMEEYGHLDAYENLLELEGCADMSPERVQYHLNAMTEVFDFAKTVVSTPYQFASDISDAARPISIDGSQEFIDRGFHREAVYWIVATYSRCLAILDNDASPEDQRNYRHGFDELLSDLGIDSYADLQERSRQVERHMPHFWEVAEAIVEANSEVNS